MKKLKTCRSYTLLVRIKIYMSYMPVELYIQEVSVSHCGRRVYVSKGAAGGKSISINSVEVLGSCVYYQEV